jgi:hypothetical protein
VELAWFVLFRGAPVVFAIHGLEGQLQPELDGAEAAETADGGDDTSDLSFRRGLSRPVIRLAALVERLRDVVTESGKEGAGSR